jgi:hypothetical protein
VTPSSDHETDPAPADVGDRPRALSPDASEDEDLVDEMVEESFPGSDPPSTWAGGDTPPPHRS